MITVRSKRTGFTLVELIAALTLTSLLLVTLMGLTGTLSRRTKTLTEEEFTATWRSNLIHQLQSDFENCRSIIVDARKVVMTGYMIPDDGSGMLGHVPFSIEYTFVEDGTTTWLVRKSIRLDRANEREQQWVMCHGFVAFSTDNRLDTDVAPGALSLRLTPIKGVNGLQTQLVRFGGETR